MRSYKVNVELITRTDLDNNFRLMSDQLFANAFKSSLEIMVFFS